MKLWQRNWRAGLLPGLSITGFVILTRLLGALQPLEWKALDVALRGRPAEETDSRITIVAITEQDIQTALGHPISDEALAELVTTLQAYQPRVIGIDIFRDRPVGEGYETLAATLQTADNVIAIDKISDPPVPPPPMLSETQVGFSDASLDTDGFLRRSQLAEADAEGIYRFSLTLRLAETYLAADGLTLENGIQDPETMRFGTTEIPRFQSNTGGYVRTDNGGNQTLINFRAGPTPFAQVSYSDVMSGQVSPELLQGRALLIGYTAESVKDFVSSGAIATHSPSLIPGIVVQAHALSQILSAVRDDRAFLKTLPDGLEYLVIFSAGLLGIALAHWQRKPAIHWLFVMGISLGALLLSYLILLASLWLPLVPTLVAFLLNAVALYPFYQAQRQLQLRIDEQEKLIDHAYTAIHNGSLQTIAAMLRAWPQKESAPADMRSQLEALNRELRGIRKTLKTEIRSSSEQLAMIAGQSVDLKKPLHSLLYETYISTLERYHDCFEPIQKIRKLDPLDDSRLTLREKQSVSRFLEEALINIYKYAEGTTRITLTSQSIGEHNIIKVIDNGSGRSSPYQKVHEGDGTKQAKRLARQLGGRFTRTFLKPQGVCCELRWPIRLSPWQRWRK
ncbi:MAG: CHASE2 domain-containing protein [Phormidesmis sp.]